MKSLLYKEFRLAIHPLFFLVPVFGALLLIPQWPYFLALIYFLFITVPNIFTTGKAQNDLSFSVMLPVRRGDIVRARILSVVALELLQILSTSIFAFINRLIYPQGNFMMDANIAFIGFVFVMFAVYNVIIFPMFYKTAYRIAAPAIVSFTAAMLVPVAVELLVYHVPFMRALDGWENTAAQLWVLAGGMAVFALLNAAACRMSVKRFQRVDIP